MVEMYSNILMNMSDTFNRRDVFFIDAYSLGSDAETGGGRRNSLFRPGG